MKILLIIESKHCGNTRKLAESMAKAVPMTITDTESVNNYNLDDFDIIGFGSGIYMGKHDKKILKLAESIHDKKAYTFIISTSGGQDFEKNNKALKDILERKNKIVLGTFSCLGLDKFFFLKLIGGVNKNHPDDDDINNAKTFILDIVEKYNAITVQNNPEE